MEVGVGKGIFRKSLTERSCKGMLSQYADGIDKAMECTSITSVGSVFVS